MAGGVKIARLPNALGAATTHVSRAVNIHEQVLTERAPIDTKGDLTAAGGYRQMIGPWARADLAAATLSVLYWAAAATVPRKWVPWKSGSITAVSVLLSTAAAGGPLEVRIGINAVLVQQEYLQHATADTKLVQRYSAGAIPFLPEDEIGLAVETTAAWTAATADVSVWLEVRL